MYINVLTKHSKKNTSNKHPTKKNNTKKNKHAHTHTHQKTPPGQKPRRRSLLVLCLGLGQAIPELLPGASRWGVGGVRIGSLRSCSLLVFFVCNIEIIVHVFFVFKYIFVASIVDCYYCLCCFLSCFCKDKKGNPKKVRSFVMYRVVFAMQRDFFFKLRDRMPFQVFAQESHNQVSSIFYVSLSFACAFLEMIFTKPKSQSELWNWPVKSKKLKHWPSNKDPRHRTWTANTQLQRQTTARRRTTIRVKIQTNESKHYTQPI